MYFLRNWLNIFLVYNTYLSFFKCQTSLKMYISLFCDNKDVFLVKILRTRVIILRLYSLFRVCILLMVCYFPSGELHTYI